VTEHVDVLIVGAGLSGIGAAHHLQTSFPEVPPMASRASKMV
jgi:cation diffusion facilitator CzcD-associated flavoprotein CzcO